jgi:hypothetical protein
MPPDFAYVGRELEEAERWIHARLERYVVAHSPDDDDYDPDSMVPAIENAIGDFLQTLNHLQPKLPCRTEADCDAHAGIVRRTKALIENTKDRLMEMGCTEHHLEDWFSGYLGELKDRERNND